MEIEKFVQLIKSANESKNKALADLSNVRELMIQQESEMESNKQIAEQLSSRREHSDEMMELYSKSK